MRKILLFSIFISVVCFSNCLAASNINVTINGDKVKYTDNLGYPYIDENNRTMVPLRITLESAGAQVGYDNNKSTAIIMHDHNRIEVPIGTDYIWKNNEKIQNDTYSVVSNGRIYLPIRIIFESLGYTVDWIQSSKTIDIYNFDYKNQNLEPIGFSVSSLSDVVDLAEDIKSGLIVYKDGQYYSTPKWRKMWSTINYHYYEVGRDVNEAIYPETDWRMTPEKFDEIIEAYNNREWYDMNDIVLSGVMFETLPNVGRYKGFYNDGLLYAMPSIPDHFEQKPTSGIFDDIEIKIENDNIFFKRSDLEKHKIFKEDGTAYKAYETNYTPDVSAPDITSLIDIKCGKLKFNINNELSEPYANVDLEATFTNKLDRKISAFITISPETEHATRKFEYRVTLEPYESITQKQSVILYSIQVEEAQKSTSLKIDGNIGSYGF